MAGSEYCSDKVAGLKGSRANGGAVATGGVDSSAPSETGTAGVAVAGTAAGNSGATAGGIGCVAAAREYAVEDLAGRARPDV